MAERTVTVGDRRIGAGAPIYFVAEIGANHDGDLGRALELVHLAAEAGADAAKFQHFTAEKLVSPRGFAELGSAVAHQAAWTKSVFDVYNDAAVDLAWTPTLQQACAEAGIEYLTSPYAPELVDALDSYVRTFKVGSGDITWIELLEHIARKGKPVLLATGASTLEEVARAVEAITAINDDVVLLQCNTNYSGGAQNFAHVNLRVLETFRRRFPERPLGLSDHTPGHAAVLGAVALGACVIEKHFTDDTSRPGPDHSFAMTPKAWREMVDRTRELEAALGDGVKRLEDNERETVVVPRRAVRAARDLVAGARLAREDIVMLRPCPADGVAPADLRELVGRTLQREIPAGELVRRSDVV